MPVCANPPFLGPDPGGLPSRTGLPSATRRVPAGDPMEFHRRRALPGEARRTSIGGRMRRASVLRTPARSSRRRDGSLLGRAAGIAAHGSRTPERVAQWLPLGSRAGAVGFSGAGSPPPESGSRRSLFKCVLFLVLDV